MNIATIIAPWNELYVLHIVLPQDLFIEYYIYIIISLSKLLNVKKGLFFCLFWYVVHGLHYNITFHKIFTTSNVIFWSPIWKMAILLHSKTLR